MRKRIYGIETEYGTLVKDEDFKMGPVEVAISIKEHIFNTQKIGLLDQHYRANDEPPDNGGFLANGGRIYLDMGHLEYASPECSNLVDLITFDRAGDMIIQEALEELGWAEQVAIIKNNVDLESSATFGCHENYLRSRSYPFDNQKSIKLLASFLVTRQILCGAGRIGACNPHPFKDWDGFTQHRPEYEKIDYQISQRTDHVPNEAYRWVQYNRAIVNTRDEPLADPHKFRRVHLLVGDSNMGEFAVAMKMGTTSLMMDLIEIGVCDPGWILIDSVLTMREISRDQKFEWPITLSNGRQTTALELQVEIMEMAKKHLTGESLETDWIIDAWESVLQDLAKGPEAVMDRVDWACKYWMLNEFRIQENLDWHDAWLKSLDLEFHNLNKKQGLFWGVEENGDTYRKTSDAAIEHAKTSP
ncbi:MAG: proteasome accessory factor PafA2 family protein, partial [Nitrospinota bacterium]|nr:proteasome accessory factor PafA2 family protein [Nitrospinota bacterium]